MDATLVTQPAGLAGRSDEPAWQPPPAVIRSLYIVVFVAGVGLAAGLTGVFLQSSHSHGDAGVNASAGLAGVRHRTDLQARVRQVASPLVAAELEPYYLACARESAGRRMDPGQAVLCSGAADRLLAETFAGDVTRMTEWWRSQVDIGASY